MRKPSIRHENLRRVLAEFDIENNHIPIESMKMFIEELKHSNLIVAGNVKEGGIDLVKISIHDYGFGLLFTDMDEFRKVFPNNEVESHHYPIEQYREMVETLDIEGFILNLSSEMLPITE